MTIEEFFQLSAGKWFSHRTSQDLASKQSKSSKSDVIIETLAVDDPEVVKLCQNYKIDPSHASCGVRFTWKAIESDKEKHSGSTVVVTVPDEGHPHRGKLLQEIVSVEKTSMTGRYQIGSDDALILTTESETIWSEERLWFASPNLRMRSNLIKRSGNFSMASYTSEIRMGGSKPDAKASEAA